MKKMSSVVAGTAVAAALLLGTAGAAGASAGHHGPPTGTPASGTNTCAVNATLSFNPPLSSAAASSATSTVMVSAQLVRCGARPMHGHTTGHVSIANAGTIPTDTCTLPSSAPTFSGLGVRWTPTSKAVPSSVAATTAGTVTTLTSGAGEVAYTGLKVTGSFATTSGKLTLDSTESVAALGSACKSSGGLASISFRGSATL